MYTCVTWIYTVTHTHTHTHTHITYNTCITVCVPQTFTHTHTHTHPQTYLLILHFLAPVPAYEPAPVPASHRSGSVPQQCCREETPPSPSPPSQTPHCHCRCFQTQADSLAAPLRSFPPWWSCRLFTTDSVTVQFSHRTAATLFKWLHSLFQILLLAKFWWYRSVLVVWSWRLLNTNSTTVS